MIHFVIFCRHGLLDPNNNELLPTGVEQTQLLAQTLETRVAGKEFEIYTSDVSGVVTSAMILRERFDAPHVVLDACLNEENPHSWTPGLLHLINTAEERSVEVLVLMTNESITTQGPSIVAKRKYDGDVYPIDHVNNGAAIIFDCNTMRCTRTDELLPAE